MAVIETVDQPHAVPRSEWKIRFATGAVVGIAATIGYRSTQHATAARCAWRSDCWAWQRVPFHIAWFVPYCSMFVLMALPWFALPVGALRRYALTVMGCAACGWIVFWVYPTACVRPDPATLPFFYRLFVAFDAPNNCLPCLHATFTVLPACFLAQASRSFHSTAARTLLLGWTGLITVSIVALRQHTGLDVLAGFVLGAIGAIIGRRRTVTERGARE